MGGGSAQPSKSQIKAQQGHEMAMMQMQMQMVQQQMAQQQAMLEYQMAEAERQRKAAEEAAKQVAIQAQSATAQQAGMQNAQTVAGQLQGQDTTQQLADELASGQYQQALTSGAENMTGGYDMALSKEQALKDLGAASGALPQTPSNLLSGIAATNPAMTTAGTQKQNEFNLPSTTGLVFGGT